MSKENDKSTAVEQETSDQKWTLEERLSKCKSRESARETIADFCADHDLDPAKYAMSCEASHIFSALR